MSAKEIDITDNRVNAGKVRKETVLKVYRDNQLSNEKNESQHREIEKSLNENDDKESCNPKIASDKAKNIPTVTGNQEHVAKNGIIKKVKNIVESDKKIPGSNVENKNQYTVNAVTTNEKNISVKSPTNGDDTDEHNAENKNRELERRESRISEKSAEAVQAYQEALERILKAAKDKKKQIDHDEDSPDIGLDLWKRAKTSVLKKMKTPKEEDIIHETQDEEKIHRIKFHRWKRGAVPPARQSGYSNRRRSITEMQNTLRKKLALRRFRRFGNLVIFCRRCVQDHCFK